MRIEAAVDQISSVSNFWVRVDHIRKTPAGLEICFAIHDGKRGNKVDSWDIRCAGVREIKITDLDGGGLAIYDSTHPAARQYVTRQAELRWPRHKNQPAFLEALYLEHLDRVDDWIPFDTYLPVTEPWRDVPKAVFFAPASKREFVCRGPAFLIRGYAKALRAQGVRVRVLLRPVAKRRSGRPKVLHFGSSYIVADQFIAQHCGGS